MILALIMASLVIAPIAEAAQKFSERTPIGSVLKSADWARVPLMLRERALFSATVESARVLSAMDLMLDRALNQTRNEFGVITDRSKFINDLTRLAEQEGLTPADPALVGGIQDVTSEARAELIYKTQTEMAYGYANWKEGQATDALDAYPAQELVRVIDSRVKRDWPRRWADAAARAGDNAALLTLQARGRMVALKTSGVWAALSRFQTPWPPFDYNSGMDVEDIALGEAQELGLIKPGAALMPNSQDFNSGLQASTEGLSDQALAWLQEQFGDQVTISGKSVRWRAA